MRRQLNNKTRRQYNNQNKKFNTKIETIKKNQIEILEQESTLNWKIQ